MYIIQHLVSNGLVSVLCNDGLDYFHLFTYILPERDIFVLCLVLLGID